jgi:hypothetical protein
MPGSRCAAEWKRSLTDEDKALVSDANCSFQQSLLLDMKK